MKWSDDYNFTIRQMDWERIFLNFTIEEGNGTMPLKGIRFAFMSVDDAHMDVTPGTEVACSHGLIYLRPERTDKTSFDFSINMCAVKKRSFLENGEWRICAVIGEQAYPVCVEYEIAYRADELSRIFKYGKNQYAYNLSFTVNAVDEKRVELILDSYFVRRNKSWRKRKYVQEAQTLKGKFHRVYMTTVVHLIRIFYDVFSNLLPKTGNKILFMTETKDYLWGNLKYIYDRMIERGLDKQFQITCSCRTAVGERNSVASWIRTVWLAARSDYIFVDDYVPVFGFFHLNKKTKLIQVWHAGEGFKSVGYSRFGKDGSPFPMGSCHKEYTYAITGAENLRKVYEEVFGIEKEAVLPLGMARLDGFLDENTIQTFRNRFYEKYPDLKGKRIILFAPTYRGTGQQDAYYDYSKLDLKALYDYCDDDTVILFKMHPFIKEKVPIPQEYQDRLFDFSSYPNINELYYITDLLITDYSSDYYEFALMQKPILFYTYDREFYELTRGVHRSIKENAPGKVCDSFAELMTALKDQDYEYQKTEQFVQVQFGDYDGHAADRIIDQILLKK